MILIIQKYYKEDFFTILSSYGKQLSSECMLTPYITKTRNLTELKPGMNVSPSKYIFTLKITGPKAHAVAAAFIQLHVVSYMENMCYEHSRNILI